MSNTPLDNNDEELRDSYDFTGKTSVRGKYYQRLREGYTIAVQQDDGTTLRQTVVRPEGTVFLDPDVRAYFPDAAAVNTALRALINLIPIKQTPQTSTEG